MNASEPDAPPLHSDFFWPNGRAGVSSRPMAPALISIRAARAEDAPEIARVHHEAWRYAYRGLLPHLPLERMIARRGARWWRVSLKEGLAVLVLEFDGEIAGYTTLGRSRMRGTPYQGEIFELYVRPGFQGAGFGRRLFQAARDGLSARKLDGLCVWALADNDAACAFYKHLGGRQICEGVERFGDQSFTKAAFAWR